MTTSYTFAALTASDTDLLRALMAVFADAFDEFETYQGAVASDAYLRSLLELPTCIVVVARDASGAVAGGLVAYVLPKFERARSEIYIYDLAVAEAHRRRGVATGLINELQRLARARGAYVIYVQADRGDAPAIALYEKFGRREDVYHFDIDVQ